MRAPVFTVSTNALMEGERREEDDEEPRPIPAAPQPTPIASVGWLSASVTDSSPHSRPPSLASSHLWQPLLKNSFQSRLDSVRGGTEEHGGIYDASLEWRCLLPLTGCASLLKPAAHNGGHVGTPVSSLHNWKSRSDVSEQIGRSPLGSFTPHIRYRTSASGSHDTRTASSVASTSPTSVSINYSVESRYRGESPARRAHAKSRTSRPDLSSAQSAAPLLRSSAPTRSSPLLHSHNHARGAAMGPKSPSSRATTAQGGSVAAVSNMSSARGSITHTPRVVTSRVCSRTAELAGRGTVEWNHGHGDFLMRGASASTAPAASYVGDMLAQVQLRGRVMQLGGSEAAKHAEASTKEDCSSSYVGVRRAGAELGNLSHDAAECAPLGHPTLRSLTGEYNSFSAKGAVDWVGLQVHLRRHTEPQQIFTLDLTRYRMRREQWLWFAQEVLPQLKALEVLHLVQMHLGDDEVAELVRGSCGLSTAADGRRTTGQSTQRGSSSITFHEVDGSGIRGYNSHSAPLTSLRVLDLSGNALTQRSCTHLGKMMLWMANTLEELRLLGNPLKDYGMQTLAVYVAKLNLETVEQDPHLFPATLRHLCARTCGRSRPRRANGVEMANPEASSSLTTAASGVVRGRDDKVDGAEDAARMGSELPLGLLFLDLRDCRASIRGVSDILAAASRAHRLQTVVLSHNVAGVTSLLPLSANEYREARHLTKEEAMESREGETFAGGNSEGDSLLRRRPFACRLRLVKTPLISSGALMRRQQNAFSDVASFTASCALSTLVFHSVPLSQTCSPLGFRELLLNIFFSCPLLDLVDFSDTFESSLVPPDALQGVLAKANRRDALEHCLSGPGVPERLHLFRESQGEVEFMLDSATMSNQTRLGDIFGELMAQAAYNAAARHRLVPAAFLHVRELHLSSTGLTDAGVRGLCVSVCRGRARTGMLASLAVLNLSDNFLSLRGCLRVISAFLLDENEGDGGTEATTTHCSPQFSVSAAATDGPVRIASLTALALQRNAGIESVGSGATAGGASGEIGQGVDDKVHLRQLCSLVKTAALRRARLHSTSPSNEVNLRNTPDMERRLAASPTEQVPPLTVYFSANPHSATRRPTDSSQRQLSFSPLTASLDIFYAGCDEQGDVYCTCPCSRLALAKHSSSGNAHEENHTNGKGVLPASQQRLSPRVVASTSTAAATKVGGRAASPVLALEANRGDGAALDNGATRIMREALQPLTEKSPPRSALAALGAPRDKFSASSESIGERLDGLVDSTPLRSLWGLEHNGEAAVGSSTVSLRSPPPTTSMTAVAALGSDSGLTTTGADSHSVQQQQQQSLFVSSHRESDLLARREASAEALLIRKESEVPSLGLSAPGGVGSAEVASVPLVEVARNETLASHPARTQRLGERRGRKRGPRTFVLSYDHPAGHLLCRALAVLLRPAPDPLGEAARAALDADLLLALRQSLAAPKSRSSSEKVLYHRGEGSGDGGDSSQREVATDATVVEAVRYLPPGLSSAALEDGSALGQEEGGDHWMRFEITTSGWKRDTVRALEAVLNAPLPDQRAYFARLLSFLDQHVRSDAGVGEERAAKDLWDPVCAIERAVRSSAAVRERLEVTYGGAAATAVHACHQYRSFIWREGGSNRGATADLTVEPADTLDAMCGPKSIVYLDNLYFDLWRELGLPVRDSSNGALQHTPNALCNREEGAQMSTDNKKLPGSLCTAAGGGDVGASPLILHHSASRETLDVTVSSSASLPDVAQQGNPQVVHLHERWDTGSQPGDEEGFRATLNRAPRPNGVALTAATDSDRCDTGWEASCRKEGGGGGISADAMSVVTPEKQLLQANYIEHDVAALNSSSSRFTPGDSNGEVLSQGHLAGHVTLSDQLIVFKSPVKARDVAEAASAPTSPQQRKCYQVSVAQVPANDHTVLQCAADGDVERHLLHIGNSDDCIDPSKGERGGCGGGVCGSALGSGGTSFSQPLSGKCEERQQIWPEPAHPDAAVVGAREATSEEDMVVGSPIRVHRPPTKLIGRLKTFTLSYLHQEGSAVCRAWLLLHTATQVHQRSEVHSRSVSSDVSVDVATPILLSAPISLASLARAARECLCDDFLAFLQPSDEDLEHAVLSVSIQCDSGVATAMLQVQVHTNERRATVADRLQHSIHGVRRILGPDGRSSLVSLSVEEVDHYYFPRLTRLLRRHRNIADTVAQIEVFLQSREVHQALLRKTYGSVAGLVHYYHGSLTSLENELGISSWQVLLEPMPQSGPVTKPRLEDTMSPPVAVDRVRRYTTSGPEASDESGGAPAVGSAQSRTGDTAGTGEHLSPMPSPSKASVTRGPSKQSIVSDALQPPSRYRMEDRITRNTKMQGRPPPHPRCPPTPPDAITHTSSISFDEVTEEPTSEVGPIVVLRGRTPTPTLRSPSNRQSPHRMHFSAPHQEASGTRPPSHPVGEGQPDHNAPSEFGGYSAGGFTTGLVSPLTVISSATKSPDTQLLGPSFRSSGVTASAAAIAPGNAPLASRALRLSLHPAQIQDPAPVPTAKSEEGHGENSLSAASAGSGAEAPSFMPLSLDGVPVSNEKSTNGSTTLGVAVPRPQLPTESADHFNADLSHHPSSTAPHANPRFLSNAAGAGGLGRGLDLDREKSEYERILEGKYKRLMRVAYDGVARGSVPLDPQHQQRTVIGRGHWGSQKIELSLEWEILFVLTFEKSRKLGRSSRRAQMLVHPVGCGFECAAGDDVFYASSNPTSLHSSIVNGELGESGHHQSTMSMPKLLRKKELFKSMASHLVITIHRPFEPAEVGSSSHDIEETLMTGALLTVSSSKTVRLLGSGVDNQSNTSRASTGVNQVAHEYVAQLCQPSLVLDIEMKSSKHVQEALRLLKNGIRRATQAVKKSMQNSRISPPPQTATAPTAVHQRPPP